MGARDDKVAVSVVVPSRNAEATIGDTLEALAAQRLDAPYEVIVVDSGSVDATVALAESCPAVVTVLANPGGEPAGSRNLGARHARGAVLAFTDADCVPEPDWLSSGLSALAGADLVQGRVVPAASPGPFDRTVAVDRDHGLYETANLFVRAELFERVGGFAPVLTGVDAGRQPFGEDTWFAWRARRAGAEATFAPAAVVRHAVFPRGARGYMAERWRCRHFPALVARIPELRAAFLYRDVFLSPGTARFDLALAGLAVAALSRRTAPALLSALPWLAALCRETGGLPPGPRVAVASARLGGDAVAFAALVHGSVSARSLVV